MLLLAIFVVLTNEQEPLFTLFGIEFSIETIALFLLIFSAGVRFFFVERLVYFIEKYPRVEVFVTLLLMIIGTELIAQGLGFDEEGIFNLLLILAIIVAVSMQRRGQNTTEEKMMPQDYN